MNTITKPLPAGGKPYSNNKRKGPPALSPIMQAVAAQAVQLLHYQPLFINHADLDDPLLRPDCWKPASKLLDLHGGRVQLVTVKLPGPHPGQPTYDLGTYSGLEALSRAGKATIEALGGGRPVWGAVEQTPVVEVHTGEWDAQGDPILKYIGTGPHTLVAFSAEQSVPAELLTTRPPKLVTSRAELAHAMRYSHKGYNSEMNSELMDFPEFIPPNPLLLALGVREREQVRREMRGMKSPKGKTVSFPPMRFTLHMPRSR